MSRKVILFKKKSIGSLVYKKNKKSGRGMQGRITVRGKGGSKLKKLIRLIDFDRFLWNVVGVVLRIEYDPFRKSFLALIGYSNYYLSYIICSENLLPGDFIISGETIPKKEGNLTFLKNIAINEKVHNIEKVPFTGARLIRSAGCFGTIVEKTLLKCCIMLPSKKKIWVSSTCTGVLGQISNKKNKYVKYKKAGSRRLRDFRPKVRGVAMNAVDHPHGGGKGKKSPNAVSSSPWRALGKNIKTVKKR